MLRRAGPEGFRAGVREAAALGDIPALRALADGADVTALPPAALVVLAGALPRADAVKLLGWAAHRSDFWAHFQLANKLDRKHPEEVAEAVGHYWAALALRPDSLMAHNNLGVLLHDRKNLRGGGGVPRGHPKRPQPRSGSLQPRRHPSRAGPVPRCLGFAEPRPRTGSRRPGGTNPSAARTVEQQMRHWQVDADLAGVRDPAALAALPEAERIEWQQLWADVVDLRARASPEPLPPRPAPGAPS